jgi:triosephosphate isomerase
MRDRILAGNWKMYKGEAEAVEFVEKLKKELPPNSIYKIVVCPPFIALSEVGKRLNGSFIHLGAQNVHWEREGAFTGEISPVMLKELGVEYVIVGHSERRKYFCETDETVRLKVKVVLENGMVPILCVGETLEERERGKEKDVVKRQLLTALEGLKMEEIERIVIAYEPVWAIGTGKTATPEEAQRMHRFLRELIDGNIERGMGEIIPIIYGGSVKPENIYHLTREPDIDGALIGGASLKIETFSAIVNNAFEGGEGE